LKRVTAFSHRTSSVRTEGRAGTEANPSTGGGAVCLTVLRLTCACRCLAPWLSRPSWQSAARMITLSTRSRRRACGWGFSSRGLLWCVHRSALLFQGPGVSARACIPLPSTATPRKLVLQISLSRACAHTHLVRIEMFAWEREGKGRGQALTQGGAQIWYYRLKPGSPIESYWSKKRKAARKERLRLTRQHYAGLHAPPPPPPATPLPRSCPLACRTWCASEALVLQVAAGGAWRARGRQALV